MSRGSGEVQIGELKLDGSHGNAPDPLPPQAVYALHEPHRQVDTIGGLLAALYARTIDRAKQELIGPWRDGKPTLVLSDAFPGTCCRPRPTWR